MMVNKCKVFVVLSSLAMLVLQSCKDDAVFVKPPYDGAKKLIDVRLYPVKPPIPAAGEPGTVISLDVKNIDTLTQAFQVLFNGEPAVVDKTSINDADKEKITVTVPDNASSGSISIKIGNQIIFGPRFEVQGKVYLDASFKAKKGTDLPVRQVYLYNGDLMLVGLFTDFDAKGLVKRINRIVRISPEGVINRMFNSGDGSNGPVFAFANTADRLFVAGGIGSFGEKKRFIHNITRLFPSGAVDSTLTTTFTGKSLGIPAYRGGSDGFVQYMFLYDNKLTIIGSSIKAYVRHLYDRSNSSGKDDLDQVDSINVEQIFRTDLDGNLDKTYRFDPNAGRKILGVPRGEGLRATNRGFIITAYQHTADDGPGLGGKIIIGGVFNKFGDKPAGSLIRLNADGTIDDTFNPGSGADGNDGISSITYNKITGKYLVAGRFLSFNGKAVKSALVMMNQDGSIDESFAAKEVNTGGGIYFARQLSDGLIVANGEFTAYGGVARSNLMFLTDKGELAKGYNNFGGIGPGAGGISDVYETKTPENKRALLVYGFILQFNGEPVNHIFRLTLE